MAACRLLSTLSIRYLCKFKDRFVLLIGSKRFRMMEQCVIFCGLIQMVITLDTKTKDINGWGLSPRGAGYLFGGDIVESVSFKL